MKIISLSYLKKKLNTNKNIKLRDVRLIDRWRDKIEEQNYFCFGDVYLLHDRYISFGLESRTHKDVNRPVLILDEEVLYSDYSKVLFAPGTTKVHKYEPTVLIAKVPPEQLKKTTFFLIQFSEFRPAKLFNRKLTELSPKLKNKLQNILINVYGKGESNL